MIWSEDGDDYRVLSFIWKHGWRGVDGIIQLSNANSAGFGFVASLRFIALDWAGYLC